MKSPTLYLHPQNDSFALARRSVRKGISYQLIGRGLILLTVTFSFCAALAQTVFVANTGSNTVSVIDAASNTVIGTVPVGVRPRHVEVSPDGRRVFVSNQGSDTVSVIDVASHAVVATIAVGDAPVGLAASPDNLKVYVTHDSGANADPVWVIDVATFTATLAFTLPNQAVPEPTATFHPNGSEIWIKNGCGDFCTRRVAYPSHVVLGDLPPETAGGNANENHISFVPGTQILYAAHGCGCCGHYDRSQYAPTIALTGRRYEDNLGAAQWTVAAPTGGIAYLARITHCTTPSSVIRKESAASDTTLAILTIPGLFTSVGAITPDGARLYLTTGKPDDTSPAVTVVDTASMSIVATIPVGSQPFGIAISPVTSGNHSPVAKCKDVTVSADSNCSASASVDDGSSDPDGRPHHCRAIACRALSIGANHCDADGR